MKEALTQEKRDEMFAAWCVQQSAAHVQRTCGVAENTVYKYRRVDRWDDRLAEVRARVEARQTETLASRMARMKTRIRSAVDVALDNLDLRTADASDVERLVKLELLISGQATERAGKEHEDVAGLSDDDLDSEERRLDRLLALAEAASNRSQAGAPAPPRVN